MRFDLRPSAEVSRFAAAPFVASGLAWDEASRRFLLTDARGRRVIVVGEGRDRSDDLVRGAAQFHDVTGLEIDARRGDLWVLSSDAERQVGTLHRLQLISGRTLATFDSPPGVVDAALTPGGSVMVLDRVTPRLLILRPGSKTLEPLITLGVTAPASVVSAGDERTVYVAYAQGILRLDLQQRTASPVTPPSGVTFAGFDRIRWHRNGLVGIQRLDDGTARVVRIVFNRARTATEAIVLEVLDAGGHPSFATVAGDDLYYLVTDEREAPGGSREMIVTVRQVPLS